MKWGALIVVLVASIGALGWWLLAQNKNIVSPVAQISEAIARPLDKYTIEALGARDYPGSQIELGEAIETTEWYTTHKFSFVSDGRKVTGMAHIPIRNSLSPVIVQFRGFVEPEVYTSGMGTNPSAREFAKNGFITLAPDGLGYGESDKPPVDVFEERFQTYVTGLNLLASIKSLPMADATRVGIWGHSNGGQIALTILEISQKAYPTVLWAPVTKPFPYSILYFTDDIPDHGKALRQVLAHFEKTYDVELYSLPNYIDRITAHIQLHQGGNDGTVPQKWSDDFVQYLKDREKDVTYYSYPSAGHSMEGSWSTVVNRDIQFFKKSLTSLD